MAKTTGSKSKILGSMRTGQGDMSKKTGLKDSGEAWYSFDQNGGMLADNGKEAIYLKTSGHGGKEWIFDKAYKSWFYLKSGWPLCQSGVDWAYYLKSE